MDETRCPLCGVEDLKEVSEATDPRFDLPGRFKVMWCPGCAVASTFPRLSPSELRMYYPDEYDPYQEGPSTGSSRFHQYLIGLEERFSPSQTDPFPPGSLLDVGCGNGQYMAAMAQRGFAVTGVEISDRAAKIVAQKGLSVITGDFLDVRLPPGCFDIISMNHYLEHSVDPRESLRKAHALLRQGGRLVVGVPNFLSWASQRFGRHWADLEVPRHTFHFSPRGLVRLLEECRFRFDRVRHEAASDSDSIATSLLVVFGKRNDPFAWRLYPILHAALYPVGLPLSILHRSAWIRVFATKIGNMTPS